MSYLTVTEYAAEKRISVRTVRAEIKKKRIIAEKIGKEYRIPVVVPVPACKDGGAP